MEHAHMVGDLGRLFTTGPKLLAVSLDFSSWAAQTPQREIFQALAWRVVRLRVCLSPKRQEGPGVLKFKNQ